MRLRFSDEKTEQASGLRGVTIRAALDVLAARGMLLRYRDLLGPSGHYHRLSNAMPEEWVAIDVVLAHYAALAKLITVPRDQREFGSAVAERVHAEFADAMRRALGDQASLINALEFVGDVFTHTVRGGDARYVKVPFQPFGGDKPELRVVLEGFPPARFEYARYATAGQLQAILQRFDRSIFVEPCHRYCDDQSMTFDLRRSS